MIYGIVGAIIGGIGGLLGCYIAIKKTESKDERNFVIKSSIIMFLSVSIFVAITIFAPRAISHALWVIYPVALFFSVKHIAKKQTNIKSKID